MTVVVEKSAAAFKAVGYYPGRGRRRQPGIRIIQYISRRNIEISVEGQHAVGQCFRIAKMDTVVVVVAAAQQAQCCRRCRRCAEII